MNFEGDNSASEKNDMNKIKQNVKKLKLNNGGEFKEPKPVNVNKLKKTNFTMKSSSFAQNSSIDSSLYSDKVNNMLKNN